MAKGIVFGMFFTVFGYAGVMNTFAPVYPAEIMPTCIRAAGVACGYATFNVIVILLVQVTPLALEAISWKYFLIFLILDILYVVIFYFFYPETKNRTLEEIEAIFGDKVSQLPVPGRKHADADVQMAETVEEAKERAVLEKVNADHIEVKA